MKPSDPELCFSGNFLITVLISVIKKKRKTSKLYLIYCNAQSFKKKKREREKEKYSSEKLFALGGGSGNA